MRTTEESTDITTLNSLLTELSTLYNQLQPTDTATEETPSADAWEQIGQEEAAAETADDLLQRIAQSKLLTNNQKTNLSQPLRVYQDTTESSTQDTQPALDAASTRTNQLQQFTQLREQETTQKKASVQRPSRPINKLQSHRQNYNN